MAKIQLKKSAILDGANALEPTNTQMLFGELAVNYNADDPSIFFKDSDESIVRIAGKNAIGNRAIDIEGYPTLTDGLGVVLDDRYLKLNSAGTQVIGSTGLTQFSGGIKVTDSTTHLLELSESGSTRVVVTNDGKLGVGTSTPTFALQVVGTVAATTATISSNLTAAQLISTVAVGTAPLSVTSTTRVNNLNSDTVDGLHAASFLRSDIDIVASNKITFSDEITVNSDIKPIAGSKVIFGSNDLDMFASSDGIFYINNKTDNNIKIQENGVNSIVIDTANRVLKPSINNIGSIGTSTRKWNAGYFQNLNSTGTITANSLNATTITGAINSSNLTGTINTARLPSTYTLAEEITIEATGSLGNLNLNADSNIEITTSGSNSFVRLSGNNGQQSYHFTKAGQSTIEGFLDFESLTSNRTFTYPDISGTIALTTSTVDNADKVDNLHASSFLRSDTADTMTGRLTFANTGNASTFNYFLRAYNDGGIRAVQFVNGSTRTADGGPNTYTIRNDGGSLRLGKSGFSTLIEGAGDLTYNSNVVWHAGNDGASSTLDADLLDGQHGSYYTGYTDTAIANLIDSSPGTLDTLNELAAALGDDANFSTTITNSLATKLPLAGGAMTGNITFSGSQTVDGRDLSADGSKLDGIETGATADQTAAEILALLTTVDGAGSGLNADKLDGHTSSYFQDASTAVNTSTTFGGDVVGTYNSLAVVNDSHTHDTRYFTETEADARFLGITAKAADSDKLDNLGSGSFLRSNADDTYTGVITGHQLHLGGSQIMSSVAKLQVNGLLRTGTIYLHEGGSSPTSTGKTLSNSSGVLQWDGDTVWTSSNNGAGSSLNADQVDGYEAADLLKSSEDDSFSGNLTGSGTIYTTGTYMGIKGNGGGVCLTTNDGGGNANVTFNHKGLVPDQSGSAGRIECAVDGGTAAMYFELEDNVTANTSTGLSNILTLTTSNFTAFGNKVWHAGNHGASSTLDADLLDGQHGSYYTGYTDTAIANLIDSSPGTLNTLNELAAALGDDANFSTTITDSIALKLPKTGGTMSGNIVFTGSQTVDGRDLSVDGTKLDGIEAGATGDQSAAEILNLLKTVDTNSSGLNADTLDGQQGSFYQDASNLTSGTIPDARITDIGDSQARIITFDNLEKSNLNGDGQIAFDSSQGLLVYRTQQGTSGAATTVLDGWNIAEGANISITNLGAGNTNATEFTFSVNTTNLDADQLDGQEGSFYQNASNLNAGTISDARIPDTITPLTLVKTVEVRGNGAQLVLNAGESSGKIASQTGEWVYVNAEGGLRISTPSVSNWGSGYVEQRTNITGGGIFFHRNTTPMGEITTQDTTWLRINQNTNKNIYTPRYIRADAGFFVDGTSKGINGNGNFFGGTIAGASDYDTLLRSNATDEYRGGTLSINSDSSDGHYVGWGLEYKSSAWRHTNNSSWGHAYRNSGGILDIYVAQEAGTADSLATYRAFRVGGSSQLLQYDGNNIWHAGNDGAGSGLDADTVDGIQAASFIRSDADDTTLGSLTIDVDDQANGALHILANQNTPVNDFYFAQKIESTLSGSTTFTGDKEQGGIWMDINSSATGGGTSHEHRAYGMYIDLDSTGDADLVYGIYSDATATPTAGTTSEVVGVYGRAEDNGGAGSVSNVHGVRGEAYSDNSTSDINNMYGGFFRSTCAPDTGNINAAHGVYAEIEIPLDTGDHFGDSYVVRAVFDNNDSVAQTNNTYLFYGDYQGTQPTNPYGIYIADNVPSFFNGNLTSDKVVEGNTLISTVATGTAPLTVTSTTKVTNLNADYLDGLTSASFLKVDADDNVTAHTEWQDNYEIRLGNGADFRMWFNGADTVFRNNAHANGDIIFQGETSAGLNQSILIMKTDGTRTYSILYENSAERFRTNSTGVKVTGVMESTGSVTLGGELNLIGTADANKFIDCRVGSNALNIRKTTGGDAGHETMARFIGDGGVELYHNNVKKFETTSTGVTITDGSLNVENATGNNITLSTMVANGNDSTLIIQKSRGGSGGPSQITAGDALGQILWKGYDADSYNEAASITCISSSNTGDFNSTLSVNVGGTNHSFTSAGFTVGGTLSVSGSSTFTGRVNIRGHLDLSDSENLDFGSSDDVRINYNSNNWLYTNFRTGAGIIFQDNGTDKMVLEDSGIFRPSTTNTGTIGSSSYYWDNGYFQDFNISATLNVRGAIDLADGDILRFGSSDDVTVNYNSNNWFYVDFVNGNGIVFRDNGVDTTILEDSGIFRPQVTNTGTIGTSSRYWAESFITQGTFQSTNNQLLLHNPDDETVIHRNDGNNYYILLSNAGAAPSGSWNALRPLYINTSTGKLHSNNGQDFAGGMSTGTITLDAGAVLSNNTDDSYDKLRVWNSSSYAIGMKSGCTHGDLNDYAMTFTMNNEDDRGFLWRDSDHGASGGAMSLSTRGSLEVSRGINTGGGETNTGWTDHPLHVDNSWQTGQNNSYNTVYIDADWSGTAAFNANKSQVGLRVDVDNSKSNTTSVAGNRHTIYGVSSTVDNTGYTHDARGGYFFAKSTASGDGIGTQSVFGVYGYAQAYVTAGAAHAYGGHFLAYRGGSTAGGTLYGVYAKAQSTTNGSGKSGNAVGGYFEVECDEDTIADAKGVQSVIDRDAGTITTGYLFHGQYFGTVGTKWGTYITGETQNYFSGNVGIGTTAPGSKLDVNGNIHCTKLAAGTASNPGTNVDICLGDDNDTGFQCPSDGNLKFWCNNAEVASWTATTLTFAKTATFNGVVNIRGDIDLADNDILRLGTGDDAELFCNGSHLYLDLNGGIGNFYIRDGTTTRYTFNDNGSFTATGNVTAYSDIKLKENIETIANPLDKVNQINGVTFDRIDTPELGRQMGVIAQDVEKVCPELVSTDEEGTKSVAYGNMVGLLIEAIKDQQKQIDELRAQLENK